MPANAPYPNETEEQFRLRMQQQAMGGGGAPGAAVAPPAAGAAMPWLAQKGGMAPGAGVMLPPGGSSPGAMASTGQLPQNETNNFGDLAVSGAELGTYGAQMDLGALDKQLAEAQALRDTAMPEGRQGGRVYTAANPLEFVAAGIKQYKGGKRAKELEVEAGKKREEIKGGVSEYTKRILEELERQKAR